MIWVCDIYKTEMTNKNKSEKKYRNKSEMKRKLFGSKTENNQKLIGKWEWNKKWILTNIIKCGKLISILKGEIIMLNQIIKFNHHHSSLHLLIRH